ncbi:hypothetical protein GCM10028798_33990 [Humibacter antri]
MEFVSRVPQELLDAATGQTRLRRLAVKWGSYSDLACLTRLAVLEDLTLGGADNVTTLTPLTGLPALSRLHVSQAFNAVDPSPLGGLAHLHELRFGNSYPGSDRSVVLPDVRWAATLVDLRRLDLPGTRILDPDLSPLLELHRLEALNLPLRRSYRRQVFALASRSPAFAGLASEYERYDEFVAANRNR